jgi:hypothetical protein
MSTSVGGTTVVGVIVGAGAGTGGAGLDTPAAASGRGFVSGALHQLPFTGVDHLMLLVSISTFCLMAGVLLVGYGRRPASEPDRDPT